MKVSLTTKTESHNQCEHPQVPSPHFAFLCVVFTRDKVLLQQHSLASSSTSSIRRVDLAYGHAVCQDINNVIAVWLVLSGYYSSSRWWLCTLDLIETRDECTDKTSHAPHIIRRKIFQGDLLHHMLFNYIVVWFYRKYSHQKSITCYQLR